MFFPHTSKKIERKIDQLVKTIENAEHEHVGQHDLKADSFTNDQDHSHKEYVAAFASMNRKHGGYERGQDDEYYHYPPGRDDTDPRDGTDPGDGPPYHRSPKEPPHHTPSAPDHVPRIPLPRMPPRDETGPHKDSTLMDMICSGKHTKRFCDLIKEDRDITDMLKDKKANITVFAPGDEAFRMWDEINKHHKMSKDMVHRVLLYHCAPGTHWSQSLRYQNTLTTMLPVKELGNEIYQRVRIGLSHEGPTVNFYNEFRTLDVFTMNGVIHRVDSILLPPPDILELIGLLPTEFSTSENALCRTGLDKEISKLRDHGMTVLVPSNRDWQKLGFEMNAFLFSKFGKPYLRALMKYHIVPGHLMYSDALVATGKHDQNKKDIGLEKNRQYQCSLTEGYNHVDLPTMLRDREISVDITRLERFMSFRVNGLTSIVTSDGIAESGSIQVPDHILMPPHNLKDHCRMPKGREDDEEFNGLYTVEEMKCALEPFVEQERMELEQLEGSKNQGEL